MRHWPSRDRNRVGLRSTGRPVARGGHVTFLAFCLAATLLARPAPAADEFALCFGTGGTVEAPAPKLPADGKAFCAEFRFKALSSVSQPVRVVSQWSDDPKAADAGSFHLGLLPGNKVAFTLRVGKGRTDTVTGKDAFTPQAWHHVLATWNGAEATVYLDGKPIGSRKIDNAAFPATSLPLVVGQPPAAGAKASQPPPAFRGFVSDVAVWSAVPAADAVAQRAAKPVEAGAAGLALHLPLREAGPAEAVKDVVSGQDARLSPALARAGWCATTMWDQPAPPKPNLHVFSYDLSAPPRAASGAGGDGPPAPVKPSRMTLIQNPKTQQFGMLWQDKASNGIFVTWVDADLKAHETFPLKGTDDGILAAGCADANGNLCYVEIQRTPANRDPDKPLLAWFRGASSTGKALGEVPLATTAGENGLNVWSYGGRWVGSMAYANNAFGLILPRTMYKSPDGLNHQGAIAVVFPANDPAKYKNHGQVSGHSFGNLTSVGSANEFLGLDLGDCYPRGVNLTKFTAAGKASRIVFTFKTQHATEARNGSPKYDEISTGGRTFYKWSNDNNTYTELGGVVEGRVSYSVVFSTDRSTEGKVLDNSRAFRECDDPRDLALVRVVKNFDQVKSTNEVSDALLAGGPPAGTTAETGGFFNFGGSWTKQRQTGVIWLTKHKSGEAARAPHPVRLADGNVLILWEKDGGSDDGALCATKVSEDGKVLGESARPAAGLKLNREDRAVASGGRSFLLATDTSSGAAKLCFVYDDGPAPAAAGGAKSGGPILLPPVR